MTVSKDWADRVLNRPREHIVPLNGMLVTKREIDTKLQGMDPSHDEFARLYRLKKVLERDKRKSEVERINRIREIQNRKKIGKWERLQLLNQFCLDPNEAMRAYKRAVGFKEKVVERVKKLPKEYIKAGEPKFKEVTKAQRSLADQDVILAREMIKYLSYRELSEIFLVSIRVLERAIKGITYKHLNVMAKPQK